MERKAIPIAKMAKDSESFSKKWSGRQDSNLRPSGPKPDALPGCATPRHGITGITMSARLAACHIPQK